MQQFSIDFSGKVPVSGQIGRQIADDNANEYWKHIFDACVLKAAEKLQFLTSDDVLAEMEELPHYPKTHNLSAIGAGMNRACEKGVISRTEPQQVQRSKRPEKHGNRQNVWKSNYWREK